VTLAVDAEPETPADPPGPSGIPRWTLAAFALGGLVLLAIAALAIAWKDDGSTTPSRWAGRELDPAPARPSTDLVDTSGAPFDLRSATAGQLTLVFFGYTNCPDICSIQMATLKQSLDRVEVPAKVVFITTDPQRDTPERLRSWLDSFDPSFIGLTGTPDAIQRAPDRMRDIVGRGALVQLTAGSFLGDHGPAARRTALLLLAGGAAHFLASDGHSAGPWRPPMLEAGLQAAAEGLDMDPQALRWMGQEGPAAVLEGGPVRPPKLTSTKRLRAGARPATYEPR
jgi:protein SCO1/2